MRFHLAILALATTVAWALPAKRDAQEGVCASVTVSIQDFFSGIGFGGLKCFCITGVKVYGDGDSFEPTPFQLGVLQGLVSLAEQA